MAVIYLFSGQGSQYRGMGRILFEQEPAFRRTVFHADTVCRRAGADFSLVDELYGPYRAGTPFTRLSVTHPAIYAVELALLRTLESWGMVADRLLGASLGEYTAMAAAGVVAEDDMLRLLLRQAEGFERHAPPGGMTAVLADTGLLEHEPDLFAGLELAAVNAEAHFVVSGPPEALEAVEGALRQRGILFQRLDVAFGFHASFIDGSRASFEDLVRDMPLRPARLPLISCVDGRARERIQTDHLWAIVRKPVHLRDAILSLEREARHVYVDLGPSGSIATAIKYILGRGQEHRAIPLLTPSPRSPRVLRDCLADILASQAASHGFSGDADSSIMDVHTTTGGWQSDDLGACAVR